MGKKKNKGKKKNGHETTVTKLVLITAILELVETILHIIEAIVRKLE